jgi:group I intron endonuclease
METGIYKIVNLINEDFYIGSALSFKKRKSQHFNLLKNNKHHSIHLQRAVDKYGILNFVFMEIELVDDKKNLLNREQFYIDLLNPKYNVDRVAGSRLGSKVSDETKLKLSLFNKGKKQNIEGVLKSAKTRTGLKRPNVGEKISAALKGKKLSESHKIKLRLAKLGKKRDLKAIETGRKTMMNKEFIKVFCNENKETYHSISDASRKLNLSVSNICNVLKGNRKTTGGLTFSYA